MIHWTIIPWIIIAALILGYIAGYYDAYKYSTRKLDEAMAQLKREWR